MDQMVKRQKPSQHVPVSPPPVQKKDRWSKQAWLLAGTFLVLVVVVLSGAWLMLGQKSDYIDHEKYQVVYTNSGQAYFGKLISINDNFFVLKQVYVSTTNDVPKDATQAQKQSVQNNTSLVRVTDEVYGPDDQMQITTNSVLFWQNLKDDSKVAKAIEQDS